MNAPTPSISAPQAPASIAETGLDEEFLVELMIKAMFKLGADSVSKLSALLALSPGLIQKLIETARHQRLVETKGSEGASATAEMRYALTALGADRARAALDISQYVGAAPVPLEIYRAQVNRQSIRNEAITQDMLDGVLTDLVLPRDLFDSIGPAVNSGASVLLYGPPGNGKSSIANAICAAFRDHVFIPQAVTVEREIITLFDSAVHRELTVDESGASTLRKGRNFDRRYKVCKRPVVVTGGELTLGMLDLIYNPVSKFYEAPIQMKAAGGIFIIDDFGRQRENPQALINRWIVPLEQNVDYLGLQSGRKFAAPFDTLVVFSTNQPPRDLMDEAGLRRIRYKIEVPRPTREEFIKIFTRVCNARKMVFSEEDLLFILRDLYAADNVEFAAFQPGYLIDQLKAIAAYEQREPAFTPSDLRRAWRNLHTME